ncbi:MAG: ATP synthase F0 subunit B [Candidatus Aminicenantes bacterium]|jgi:F-type H+-transporting ATPase subunit b|nr:ATP synthase F0 subunit B [Candidatus Aminicenantes bacterium]
MKTSRRKIFLVLLLLPFFISMVSADEEHSSNFRDFIGKAVNFIVLFGGLAYFLYKPIRNFLQKRSQEIEQGLKEAGDAQREAELKLREANARLATLEDEIEKLKKEAEIEGRKEREKVIQLAQQEAERIKYFAKQEIEMLMRAGIQDLKQYTAELASALAEERIKKKMSPEDQSFLIDKSIEKLDELYEKSYSRKKIHSRVS